MFCKFLFLLKLDSPPHKATSMIRCGLGNAACPCRDKQCNLGTLIMKPPSNVKTFEHPQLLQTFHLNPATHCPDWGLVKRAESVEVTCTDRSRAADRLYFCRCSHRAEVPSLSLLHSHHCPRIESLHSPGEDVMLILDIVEQGVDLAMQLVPAETSNAIWGPLK